MKFLLFEWMVGGGLIASDELPHADDPFFQQGGAMFAAMAEDLIAAGHSVCATVDNRACATDVVKPWARQRPGYRPHLVEARLPQKLRALAITADQIILIAPECDGILSECYRWLESYEEKLLGGPVGWIELASNKNAMQSYLQSHGVPVPSTAIEPQQRWVAKPVDGAGSTDVQIFSTPRRLEAFQRSPNWRTEQYVAGKPVSVSVIGNLNDRCCLPPTGQIFSSGESGHYSTAEFPLRADWADRARELAEQTVKILPEFRGYIGIDMVLAETGPDVVIEINPRMTMSYCHLPLKQRRQWLKGFQIDANNE